MDYKEKVIALLNDQELSKEQKEKLENIFPELQENKDDRIVRCLLNYFNHVRYNGLDLKGTDIDEVIAWLEKQGKQKHIINVPPREVILSIWDLGNEWKELTNGCILPEYGTQLDYIQKHWHESEYYLKANQDEKKELKKIESKTLDADKVIAWLVANICDFEYYVTRFKKDFGL